MLGFSKRLVVLLVRLNGYKFRTSCYGEIGDRLKHISLTHLFALYTLASSL